MKLSIIGFGNHVTKNIIPALNQIKEINIDTIYVRDLERYQEKSKSLNIKLSLMSDFNESDTEWLYVSTPISTHYSIVKKALILGKNVICEKPITDSFSQTKELYELATANGCQLHEVCMYLYHKQYKYLESLVCEQKANIKSVNTRFSIPHLSKNDIRYNKSLGGGALLDVGFYPISILINLFGIPISIEKFIHTEDPYDVDLTGTATLSYDGFYCIAEWGIGCVYSNELTLQMPNEVITFDRIFSKPDTLDTSIEINDGFNKTTKKLGKDNHFKNLFKDIMLDNSNNGELSSIEISRILDELY